MLIIFFLRSSTMPHSFYFLFTEAIKHGVFEGVEITEMEKISQTFVTRTCDRVKKPCGAGQEEELE